MSERFSHTIFRAYDIRGIYPEELNEKGAELIGRAFTQFLVNQKLENQISLSIKRKFSRNLKIKNQKLDIVVGRDDRLSSPSLFSALTKGIIDQGANVIDIGLSTTPMLYFATAYFKSDGGIEISASHNPPQYNGFKLVKKEAIPIGQKSGIKEIKGLVLGARFKSSKRGKVIKKKVIKEYLKFNLRNFDLEKMKPLKIVIDTANAVAGILIPEIFEKTNFKIYHLFPKLDGNFPGHFPDPLIKENLRVLQKEVKNKKANLGVAFDGDGDRIIFLDERGEVIPGDLITALLSKIILKENPDKKILYDIRSSNVVGETIKICSGTAILSRIGHTFIKEKMREKDIFFAGEFSGHYYLKEHYFCEAPIFVLLKILEIISSTGKNLSELIWPFKKYFHSGEINFRVRGKNKILEIMEKRYKNGKINHIDGVRIDFKNWWFLVRPSQTEPVLRLVIEAKTKEIFEEKKKELIELIKSFSLG